MALSCSGFLGGGGAGAGFLGGGCGFLGTWSRRRISSGGLASVVLLVGGAGPVIVPVILAAGTGIAGVAAGTLALAVLDVAVAAFGGGARAGANLQASCSRPNLIGFANFFSRVYGLPSLHNLVFPTRARRASRPGPCGCRSEEDRQRVGERRARSKRLGTCSCLRSRSNTQRQGGNRSRENKGMHRLHFLKPHAFHF